MQCPICQNRQLAEIDCHDSSYVKECLGCGAVWSRTNKEISMISIPKKTVSTTPALNI